MPIKWLRIYCSLFGHNYSLISPPKIDTIRFGGSIYRCCRCRKKMVHLTRLPAGPELIEAFNASSK